MCVPADQRQSFSSKHFIWWTWNKKRWRAESRWKQKVYIIFSSQRDNTVHKQRWLEHNNIAHTARWAASTGYHALRKQQRTSQDIATRRTSDFCTFVNARGHQYNVMLVVQQTCSCWWKVVYGLSNSYAFLPSYYLFCVNYVQGKFLSLKTIDCKHEDDNILSSHGKTFLSTDKYRLPLAKIAPVKCWSRRSLWSCSQCVCGNFKPQLQLAFRLFRMTISPFKY